MASSNKTPHYQLSQFAPTDKPAWQGDYNSDMKKIDNGIYAAQNKADSLDASVSEATNKATQALEKAEAAEDAAENAAALAQEAKTTADNISGDLSGKVNKAGDTMTGPLVLSGDPTQPMEAATKKYVDEHGGGASGDFLPLSGGTMTGPITLAADPTTAMQAATKQYADKMLPLAGGTMTGALTLPADPTSDMQAATKKYVDQALSGGDSLVQQTTTQIVSSVVTKTLGSVWANKNYAVINLSLVLSTGRIEASEQVLDLTFPFQDETLPEKSNVITSNYSAQIIAIKSTDQTMYLLSASFYKDENNYAHMSLNPVHGDAYEAGQILRMTGICTKFTIS